MRASRPASGSTAAVLAVALFAGVTLGTEGASARSTSPVDGRFADGGRISINWGFNGTVAARPDGSLMFAGGWDQGAGSRWQLRGFTRAGHRDRRFGDNGLVNLKFHHPVADRINNDVAEDVLSDGRGGMVVVGQVDQTRKQDIENAPDVGYGLPGEGWRPEIRAVRITRDGRIDRRFGKGGKLVLDRWVHPTGEGYSSGFNRFVDGFFKLRRGFAVVLADPKLGWASRTIRVITFDKVGRNRRSIQIALPPSTANGPHVGGIAISKSGAVYVRMYTTILMADAIRTTTLRVLRFTRAGAPDPSYVSPVVDVSAGSLDPVAWESIRGLELDGSGFVLDRRERILFGYTRIDANGLPKLAVGRLNRTGRWDPAFGDDGTAMIARPVNSASSPAGIAVSRSGVITVAGAVDQAPFNGRFDFGSVGPAGIVARFTDSGRLLKSWSDQGIFLLAKAGYRACVWGGAAPFQAGPRTLLLGCQKSGHTEDLRSTIIGLKR